MSRCTYNYAGHSAPIPDCVHFAISNERMIIRCPFAIENHLRSTYCANGATSLGHAPDLTFISFQGDTVSLPSISSNNGATLNVLLAISSSCSPPANPEGPFDGAAAKLPLDRASPESRPKPRFYVQTSKSKEEGPREIVSR